jgi:ribulose-phosphate 3-epimerase
MRQGLIAPSILSADFAALADDTAKAEAAGADWLHVDVMDGHFVPNITLGPVVIGRLKARAKKPLDVHLMISKPSQYADVFLDASADILSFHLECDDAPLPLLQKIRQRGCKAGLCLKPATAAEALLPHLPMLDLVVVMSVEPGFGGQKFMPDMMAKVRLLSEARQRLGLQFLIEVDGGITSETAPQAWKAGADVLVAGTAVFGKPDYAQAIAALRMKEDHV